MYRNIKLTYLLPNTLTHYCYNIKTEWNYYFIKTKTKEKTERPNVYKFFHHVIGLCLFNL